MYKHNVSIHMCSCESKNSEEVAHQILFTLKLDQMDGKRFTSERRMAKETASDAIVSSFRYCPLPHSASKRSPVIPVDD